MSLRILPDLVQGSDEWLDQRRGMVTASAVGQLLSVRHPGPEEYDCPACGAAVGGPCVSQRAAKGATPGPIKTMHPDRVALAASLRDESPLIIEPATGNTTQGLTALLAAERITDWTDPQRMTDDMWRGMEDEPRAREVYSRHHAPVETTGFMVRDDWGFEIGYSPDGLVEPEGLVEIKSRRQKIQLLSVLDGEVPAENMAQIQCGLLVSGRAWCDYVSYTGGMALWRVRVFPDPRWFEAIVAAVQLFEDNAAAMISAYMTATDGLPMTERVELEIV